MVSLYSHFFNPKTFGQPYDMPEDHLLDLVRQCEMLLAGWLPLFAPHVTWKAEVAEIQGMGEPRVCEQLRQDWRKAQFHINSRMEASQQQGTFLAAQYVREVLKLSDLEWFALILWLLPDYDDRFGTLFGQLRNNPGKRYPSADLVLKLFYLNIHAEEITEYHRLRHGLLQKAEIAFLRQDGGLDERIRDFLLQNGRTRLSDEIGETFVPEAEGEPLLFREEEAECLARAISEDSATGEPLYICLRGPGGMGRVTHIRRVSQLLEVPTVFFDCGVCSTRKRGEFFAALHTAGRETILLQGMLALKRFEALLEEPETAKQVLELAGRFSGVVFVCVTEDIATIELAQERRWLEVVLRAPDKKESIRLWERELSRLSLREPVDSAQMANKFTFTPAQIRGTGQTAAGMILLNGPLTQKQLTQAAYQQVSHRLGDHATLIYARHTWDQLVLGENEKEMLRSACDQVRYQHVVYDQWGFDQRLAYGKGVSMLFAGPPGTGKTMAAQVVANELGIEMYKVDLSRVVSKYIGETEKNLDQVFREAKKSNVILFFDETDAILGKRTEVKDSHDKNANLETAYLLQKMEEYDGITVMTTNYKENIDSAFFRRISYIIHFSLPDVKARKAIWKGIFPRQTPLAEDVDFDYLAGQFELSGGNIKNIALVASFMAARAGEEVGMEQLVRAIRYEMIKQGKIMLREDYGEYGYLLD